MEPHQQIDIACRVRLTPRGGAEQRKAFNPKPRLNFRPVLAKYLQNLVALHTTIVPHAELVDDLQSLTAKITPTAGGCNLCPVDWLIIGRR